MVVFCEDEEGYLKRLKGWGCLGEEEESLVEDDVVVPLRKNASEWSRAYR